MTAGVPTLDPGRCVHARSPQAGCADCIAACAPGAVTLGAAGIVIDPAACTGCGGCVGACPTRALTMERAPPPQADGTPILICRRHPAAAGRPAPVCIQSYGLQDLARWALSGVARLACATGDCATCPDRPAPAMTTLAARFAPVFAAHGAPMPVPTRASDAEIALWQRRVEDGPAPAKRALLRALARPLAAATDGEGHAPPLARLQAQGGAVMAFVPAIDPARCTGCDACLRLCPEDALTLQDGAYRLNAARCTGCLLCEDVCADSAIEVDSVTSPAPDIPLTTARCRACGVTGHWPAAASQGELCPICARTGHHQRLFQVLR